MKVKVTRTSNYNNKPCEGVEKEVFDRIEVRTCTEEEFDLKFGLKEGLWKSKGHSHGTENEGKWITRRHTDKESAWFMEINNLYELIKFINFHGECVISTTDYPYTGIALEIYDRYRE